MRDSEIQPANANVNFSRLLELEPEKIVSHLVALTARLPQAPLKYEHEFPSPGVYRRTMKAPASCLIIGDVHALPSRVELVSGRLLVWDKENGTRLVKAPFQVDSTAGIQRVGYTFEPVVWSEIFHTQETNLERLEKLLRVPGRQKELAL